MAGDEAMEAIMILGDYADWEGTNEYGRLDGLPCGRPIQRGDGRPAGITTTQSLAQGSIYPLMILAQNYLNQNRFIEF